MSRLQFHSLTVALAAIPLLGLAPALAASDAIPVVPKPTKVEPGQGAFTFTSDVIVVADGSSGAVDAADCLVELLARSSGLELPIRRDAPGSAKRIAITSRGADRRLGLEGYELVVTPNEVTLRAPGSAGLFYGVQTIRQLLPPQVESPTKVEQLGWAIPCVRIVDQPRFQWRGLLLDTSRTFLPITYLKRYIDLLALYKMNVLHLHLTDDQGWRLEIKSCPRLTSVGSKFDERYNEFGGYYTQDQVRDLVAYAARKHVTIVPEIEMPGHAAAALAAYPSVSCAGDVPVIFPFTKALVPGLQPYNFCPGREETFQLLERVLTEVTELFPSRYIHIGGDEVVKDKWKACPQCQARIRSEQLHDEAELQSYFVKRVERFLRSKGRTLIGWDEILEGGLAPNAAVMSWRGTAGGMAAISAGHDVVFSPHTHLYLDYPNDSYPASNVYAFEPMPEGLTAEQARHVLGAQANMWTHLARSEDAIDRQIFPRLLALSEVVWSPRDGRGFPDFRQRAERQLTRLDVLGVKHAALQ